MLKKTLIFTMLLNFNLILVQDKIDDKCIFHFYTYTDEAKIIADYLNKPDNYFFLRLVNEKDNSIKEYARFNYIFSEDSEILKIDNDIIICLYQRHNNSDVYYIDGLVGDCKNTETFLKKNGAEKVYQLLKNKKYSISLIWNSLLKMPVIRDFHIEDID